jgi:predicted ATP-grasp superfamily ATP-dependent carboligase
MHLQRELEKLGALDQPLILQEWIPGNDQQVYFGLAYFSREGVPLGIMTGRKLRQYPSLTGVTSLAESIEHQKVSELTLEILKTAGCRGLCSVEFKLNPIDNSFQITEPTVGRVDLQEGISTHAGLDLPFIAYQDAIGISQSGKTDFKTGLKWINEPFEFNTLITRIRGDRNGIVKFFFPYRGHLSFALFARDDPMPFIRFLIWGGNRAFLYLKNLSQ